MDDNWRSNRVTLAMVAALVPTAFFGGYLLLSQLSAGVLTWIVAAESVVAVAALAVLNTRVGYRKRDIAFLAVPIYGFIYLTRMLWRGAHLSNPYWVEPTPVDTELYRYAAFSEFVQMGVSRSTADILSLAMFPLDDEIPASPGFSEVMYEESLATADAIRTTNVHELEEFAIETMQHYIELAHEWNEPYYASRYGTAIDESRGRSAPSKMSNQSNVESLRAETLHSASAPEADH